MAANVEHRAIECSLKRRGDVTMDLSNFCARLTRGNEVPRQPLARLQIIFAIVPGAVQAKNWNSHGAIGTAFEHLLKYPFKLPRVAVRRESHDLVFVGIKIEPEMVGHQRVKYAQR